MLFTTIWHTGTTYFRNVLDHEGVEFEHVSPEAVEKARHADKVYTTWRDPYRVGASWGNRGRIGPRFEERWVNQWSAYKNLLELDPIVLDVTKGREQGGYVFGEVPLNVFGDKHGLHQVLDRGDLDTYHQVIPKEWIEIAFNSTNRT